MSTGCSSRTRYIQDHRAYVNMGTINSTQLEYDHLSASESDDNDELINSPGDERHLLVTHGDIRSDRILKSYKHFKTLGVITVWVCLVSRSGVASVIINQSCECLGFQVAHPHLIGVHLLTNR
jgi:hypothetical protein